MSSPQLLSRADDANRNGEIISASLTLLILPTVFVALRIVSRHLSKAGFSWDDGTVVIAMMLSWGPNIINLMASRTALGHHTTALSLDVLYSFYRKLYAFQVLYSLAISSAKCSVILFQYRIFGDPSFRRIIIACGILVVAFEIASTITFIFECVPIRDYWLTIGGSELSKGGGRCINLVRFLLVNGSINTITDFALLLLPLPMIWRLRASTLQKYIITSILATGLMVTAVSMVRLVVLGRYHGTDITYDFVPTCIWTAAEPSIAVVSACLPSLRPLIVHIIWGSTRGPENWQGQYFSSSNKKTSAWRGGSKVLDRRFSRLPESVKGTWSNGVTVYGGRRFQGTEEEILELSSPREGEVETPINRIRAKTTVTLTISERVDWKNNLF